jgi:hypothetical protein
VDGRKAGDYSPRLAEYTSVLTAPRCKGTELENENKKRLLGVSTVTVKNERLERETRHRRGKGGMAQPNAGQAIAI